MEKTIFSCLLFFTFGLCTLAQLKVDIYPTEEFMITQMLMGDSSTNIWNVQFKGTQGARGIFYSENTVMPISEGLLISSGSVKSVIGPNKGPGYSTSNRSKGDLRLQTLAHIKTYDATSISFEFEAKNNLIRFNYVFASEEYPEYVGSTFNDVFAFFLTDLENGDTKNLAVIPNTDLPITVNNINHKQHKNFYLPNSPDPKKQIEFDGMTQPLIAYSEVIPGKKYQIQIVIADAGDDAFDSGVFLEGKSFKSEDKANFFKENTSYFEAFHDANLALLETESNVVSNVVKTTLSTPISKVMEDQNENLPPPSPTPISNEKKHGPDTKNDSIIIYFGFDAYEPLPNELAAAKIKLVQMNLENSKIQIIGHTDQIGTNSYNQLLSMNRALTIKNWFFTNFTNSIATVKGVSFHQLAQNQNNQKSWAKNRRVVILISP